MRTISNHYQALAEAVTMLKVIAYGGSYNAGDFLNTTAKLESFLTDDQKKDVQNNVVFDMEQAKVKVKK